MRMSIANTLLNSPAKAAKAHQTTGGELAEWLRSGLQIRVHEFDSRTRLHNIL